MADIFLTLTLGDEDAGEGIADALRRYGFSVKCPHDMPKGSHGESWLQAELDRASCVPVLWSRAAVGCTYVRNDATRAVIDGKYVPVLIDPLSPEDHPHGFPLTGAMRLHDWAGAPDHAEWCRFMRAVRRMCTLRFLPA